MTRYGLVVNPTSGKGRGADAGRIVAERLGRLGHEVLDLTRSSGSGALAAAKAAVAGHELDALVVVGGDGMAHLGVNAVAGSDVPLGLVAAGTGNDLAQELGLPVHDPVAATDQIVAGAMRRIDAVRTEGPGDPRWFVGVLAAGFDAVVNERANGWRWPRGQSRYTLATLRELPVFRPIRYAVTLDGERRELAAMLVAVGNTAAYGGGMRITPDAELDDGLLDVLFLHEVSTWTLLRVFPRVFSGRHISHPRVEVVRARTVTLEATGVVAYADGERFGPLPLSLAVVPGAVTMLVAPAAP